MVSRLVLLAPTVVAAALLLLALVQVEAQSSNSCSYYSSCSTCGQAPSSYNCGWCDSSKSCVQGTSYGPDYPSASCPSTAWGFRANACYSPSASCGLRTTNCGSCLLGSSCGWCGASSTCMLGSSTGPSNSQYCSYNWQFYSYQCSQQSDPCQNYASSCSSCSSAPSSYACGWCSSTNSCVSGDYNGPNNGYCSPSYWQWRSCSCSNFYSCSSCVTNNGCVWCGDGDTQHTIGAFGGCMSSSYASSCSSNDLAYSSSTCNAYPSGSGGGGGGSATPSVDSEGSASAAQTSGIVLLSITALSTIVFSVLYGCVPFFRPNLGSNLRSGAARDFTTQQARSLPFALLFFSIVLKVVGAGLDRWSIWSVSTGMTVDVYFGLFHYRASAMGQSITISYAEACKDRDNGSSANDRQLCGMLLSGSILAFISMLIFFLCLLVLIVLAIMTISNRGVVHTHVFKFWRAAGLNLMFTITAIFFWLWGPFFALHHQDRGVRLGPTWILMWVGLLFDFLLVLFYRSNVHNTADPQFGSVTTAVAIPVGIVPLISSQGQVAQAYPVYPGQQYAPAPQAVQFSGYAVQPGGPQPYAPPSGYVPPPQQNPAAYAPLQ